MFTIKELEDRWDDYESACLLTIKQLLADYQEITFESDDLSMCPVCIGDNGMTLIDGIVTSIYLHNGEVYITYKDREYPECAADEDIRYITHINYIDIIMFIKETLRNGKTNLG